MISIGRKQVRILRTVFRRCGDSRSLRTAAVFFAAGPDGLRVQCRSGDWAVEQKFEGQHEHATIGIPLAALADFEGSSKDEVNFETDDAQSVSVHWTDAGVPQQRKYKIAYVTKAPLLEASADLSPGGDFAFFEELAELCRSTAKDASRYVLNCILLRGQWGDGVATDGMQLLKSNGFSLPWNEDVLIPRTKLFEAKELSGGEQVRLARTADHVVFAKGNWTIWAPIEKNGRYPDIDIVIPSASMAKTSTQLSAADAEFLAQAIPRLPGADVEYSPVTIHCNGHVAVRAKDAESAALTELSLDGSTVAGDEVLVVTNRHLLARTASLGMKSIHFRGADDPALCTGDRRIFVWKPLSGDPLKSDANATVIHSGAQAPAAPVPPIVARKSKAMPAAVKSEKRVELSAPAVESTETPPSEVVASDPLAVDPIAEAEVLKTILRDALIRVSRLGAMLRRQQRTTKLMKSTLLSLRQLGEVG